MINRGSPRIITALASIAFTVVAGCGGGEPTTDERMTGEERVTATIEDFLSDDRSRVCQSAIVLPRDPDTYSRGELLEQAEVAEDRCSRAFAQGERPEVDLLSVEQVTVRKRTATARTVTRFGDDRNDRIDRVELVKLPGDDWRVRLPE